MNGSGPEGKGSQTGRGLGKCQKKSPEEIIEKLGTGMGLKRKAGGGQGQGKRLRSGIIIPKK
jgi:hypothetical protein